jgi:hypothetical protein
MGEVQVERGSGGLGGRPVKDGGDTCRVAGDAYGVRYSQRFGGFGPQNHRVDRFTGLGLKTRVDVPRRDGRHVAASKSSCRGEAIS